MASSYLEPVSPAVEELLAVFAQHLATLRFPEADGQSLHELASDVRAAAAAARRLDEEAERAYRALAEQQEKLLQKAARARRYARIYAEAEGATAVVAALDATALAKDDVSATPQPAAKTKTKAKSKQATSATPQARPQSQA